MSAEYMIAPLACASLGSFTAFTRFWPSRAVLRRAHVAPQIRALIHRTLRAIEALVRFRFGRMRTRGIAFQRVRARGQSGSVAITAGVPRFGVGVNQRARWQ